jgi:Bacterial regulatory proteins, luxR family
MVAEGHPNKIIADVLNISPWTVCTYLRRIFAKLGVTSRAAMVARTPEIGWTRDRSGPELRAQNGRILDHITSYEALEPSKTGEGSNASHHAPLRRPQR